MKKTALYGYVYDFLVKYDIIDVADVLDIHKYLMVNIITLLGCSRSLASKCVSLNNKPCMVRPTLTDLNPVELNCYAFMISLDKRNGSCYAADNLSTKICIPSKTKGVNVKVVNIIKRMNKAKTLLEHI